MRKKLTCLLMAAFLTFGASMGVQAAQGGCDTYEGGNVGSQDYNRWTSTRKSYTSVCDDGALMRIQYVQKLIGTEPGILVEYYDKDYNLQKIRTKKVPQELPIFGGFHETDTNYYLVTGQTNSQESADVEVYRITKYDKDWNRISSVGLYDCNTTVPFDAGTARMDDNGKYLIIHTCHEMYKSSDGYNHQANVTIQVDMDNMKITDSYTRVMNSSVGYVSHSFNQFVKIEGNNLVTVDHGDANPRGIVLIKYPTDITTGSFTPGYGTCKVINVMEFAGESGDNTTGAAIGGFEISSSSYLIAGHSVEQDADFASHKTRNVFVAAVDRTTNKVTINWLTDFTEGDGTTSTPQLVKTGDDQFMVLWSRNGKVCCQQIGADGKPSGTTFEHEGSLSDDEPVVSDGKLLWYTWEEEKVTFQDIEVADPSSSTVTPIENGHQYENLGVTDGKAHLRCTVCGGETELTVATSLAAYWNKVGTYGSYSSVLPKDLSVDDTLYMWLNKWEPADADKTMEVEIENPGRMEYVKTSSLMGYFRLLKPGDNTITIYPKYNPDCKKTYKLTVTGPLQMDVDLAAAEASPQPFGSTVTLSALAVGGSGEIQYRFAVVDAAGNETLLQDYAAANTVTWTPAAAGTYRILADIKDGVGTELPQQVIEEYVVSRAAAPVLEAEQKSYREGLLKTDVTVEFASKLPADRGETVYSAQIQDREAGKDWLTAEVSEEGILTYTVSDQTVAGDAADIILTADSANYEPITLTVKLTIVDGYPVTQSAEYPVALAENQLTYGQRLEELTLNTDTAVFTGPEGEPIAGTLAWVDLGHIPTVAETTAEWIFTPKAPEFEDYKTCTGALDIAVAKAVVKVNAPKVPGRTYHPAVTLEKIALDGADGSVEYDGSTKTVAGTWSWKDPETVPTVVTNGYAAVFTPDDTDNYEIAECEVTVPVAKAFSVIQELPAADSITFGQSLKDAKLTGGSAVLAAGEGMEETAIAGTFSWADETVKPTAGDKEYFVIFTPEDADNYEAVASKMTVTVAKAPAQPETISKTYCEGIAREKEQEDLALLLPKDCGKVAYTFAIQDKASVLKKDSISVSEDGLVTYGIESTAAAGDKAQIIVTASSENYEDTDYTIDIEITEKLDVISRGKVTVSGSLAYGQKLSELELNRENVQFVDIDGNYVDGTLAWTDGELLSPAGIVSVEWTFTPDKEEYAICIGRVDVKVTRTVPMLPETGLSTEPCPYTAGLTLKQIGLVDTKVTAVYAGEERIVEGSWSWAEPDTKLTAGVVSCNAVFTPEDIANYQVVETEINVQVDKETLKLSENPTTSVLTYGQTLEESAFNGGKMVELNGGVPVAGSFSWDKPDTIPPVGESIYKALFTPEDTENYVPAEIEVAVEVQKAVVPPMSQSKEYREGYAKADQKVDFAAKLPGNRGATTYNAQIQYRESGKDWLTAQINEEGSLTYTVSDQTVVGDAADIILTADSENYETATLTVHVTIVDGFPVTQSAEHPVALADNQLTYGQRLNRLALNTDTAVFTGQDGEPVKGTLSWKDPDCIPKASETQAEWIFTPLLPEYEEYKECTGTLEIAVAKAFVKVISPKVSDQKYHPAVTLESIALNGTDGSAEYDGKIEMVAGVWSWKEPQTVPTVGAKPYEAVFTPDDAENYETVECEVTVPVAKATPEVQVVPAVDSLVFGQKLGDAKLTGGKAVLRGRAGMVSVPGTFAWSDATVQPAVSDSGKTEYDVVFTPEDTDNYETVAVACKMKVTVVKAPAQEHRLSKRYCQNIARENEQVNLARLLPKDCGEVTYTVAMTDQDGVLKPDSVSVSDGTLSYSILESAQAGNTAQITVTAVTENYEDTMFTVEITITDKLDVYVRDEVTVSESLAYGQYLEALSLGQGVFVDMYGNPVKGTVAWAEPELLPSRIGTIQVKWIFTPEDEQYSTYTDIIEVQVEKAVPLSIEGSLSAEPCTYRAGLKLSDISLVDKLGGVPTQYAGKTILIEGSWSWAQPDTGLAAGSVPYKAVFTPEDTVHYAVIETDVNVEVAKAVPETAEIPTVSAITYGQTLEAAVPGGGKMLEPGSGIEVAGKFVWSVPGTVPAVKDSQTTQYELMFVPADAVNYEAVPMKLVVEVKKAAEAPDMPAAEQKVSCDTATLAGVPLPAGWSWQAGTDAAVSAGGAVFTAVYADTENYEKYSQEIHVLRAADAHSWGDGVVTREPTTEAEGEKTFTCGYCGATRTEPVEKLQPETPVNPTDPTNPTDPANPTNPADPANPTTPADPTNPADPSTPTDPANPALPQPVQGASLTDAASGAVYTVTRAAASGAGEVQYRKKAVSSAAVVNIPSEIVVNGTAYKVTSIAPRAFQNNKKLKKVTIGNYVTDIGKYAFAGCTKLTSVTIGKRTAKLGDSVFSKCTSLKKITIPASVKKLGKNVFYGCKKLKTIVVKTKKLTTKTVSSRAFSGCPKKVTVKVPASKYKTYKKLFPKKGLSKKARIRK